MTTWRELCRELINSRGADYYRTLERARKALADGPAAGDVAGPTDEELLAFQDKWFNAPGRTEIDVTEFQRATLARWGTPNLAETRSSLGDAPAPVPVPVSERLPGPEDCDAEGRCWLLTVEDEYPQWRLHSIKGNQPGGSTMIWVPVDSSPGVMVDAFYASHWLPATALPLPQGEVE